MYYAHKILRSIFSLNSDNEMLKSNVKQTKFVLKGDFKGFRYSRRMPLKNWKACYTHLILSWTFNRRLWSLVKGDGWFHISIAWTFLIVWMIANLIVFSFFVLIHTTDAGANYESFTWQSLRWCEILWIKIQNSPRRNRNVSEFLTRFKHVFVCGFCCC